MSSSRYIPQQGDVVWLNFDPQAGSEQAGRRPAVVISPGTYNGRSGLALLCPITNQVKGYPFEVALPEGLGVSGVILADQVRNLDWRARRAEFMAKLPVEVMDEVLQKIGTLLQLSMG